MTTPPPEPRRAHHCTCRKREYNPAEGEAADRSVRISLRLRGTRAPHPHPSPPRRVEDAPPARWRGPRSPGRTGHARRRSPLRLRAAFRRPAHLRCEVSWVPAYAGMTSDGVTRAPHPPPSPPRRVEDAPPARVEDAPPARVEDAPPARRRGPRSPGRMEHIRRRARPPPRAAFRRRTAGSRQQTSARTQASHRRPDLI